MKIIYKAILFYVLLIIEKNMNDFLSALIDKKIKNHTPLTSGFVIFNSNLLYKIRKKTILLKHTLDNRIYLDNSE